MKLKQLIAVKKGKKEALCTEHSANKIRYLQIEDLRSDNNLKYCEIGKNILAEKNDILIAWDGANAGTVGNNLQGAVGSTLAILRPDNSKVYSPYLSYFLKTKSKYLRSRSKGATIPHLSREALDNLEINLPLLPIQVEYSNKLDRIDKLIEKRQLSIKKLDELLQSVFYDMFGDIKSNSKKWKLDKVGNYIDLLTGYPFGSKNYSSNITDTKICGGLIIYPDFIDWSKANYWPKANNNDLKKYYLNQNDIVMALDRPWINAGFKIAMINKDDIPSLLIQRTARIRAIEINHFYLYNIFKDITFKKHCKPTETTVPHISPNDIREFVIPLPPRELQDKFEKTAQSILKQKKNLTISLNEIESLFKSLLHQSLNADTKQYAN